MKVYVTWWGCGGEAPGAGSMDDFRGTEWVVSHHEHQRRRHRQIFSEAQKCRKKIFWVGAQKWLEKFSLNTWQMMTFLQPLVALMPNLLFSLNFGVRVPSGAVSVCV